MHQTARSGPCGLPDGHGDRHRTLEGARRNRALDARYNATEARRASRARWEAQNPVKIALKQIRQNAERRVAA